MLPLLLCLVVQSGLQYDLGFPHHLLGIRGKYNRWTQIRIMLWLIGSGLIAIFSIKHIQIPPDQLRGSHKIQYRCGCCKSGVPLRVLWGYSAATACTVASVTVMSEYHHSSLQGTQTCSNHSGTAALRSWPEESGCACGAIKQNESEFGQI